MGTEQPLALELLDTPGPQWDPRLFIMTESQASCLFLAVVSILFCDSLAVLTTQVATNLLSVM
jgi:hypothetical protein